MEVNALNELMAALGFIIPSAVLWQVWNIRGSFNRMQEDVAQLKAAINELKRTSEDAALIKKITGG